jgi:hypothetical protein
MFTLKNSLYSLSLVACIISCSRSQQSNSLNRISPIKAKGDSLSLRKKIDTTAKYSLQSNSKKSLGLTEIHLKKDTLEVVTTSSFFYYPFGEYSEIPST